MKEKDNSVKIRYSPEEFEKIKENAKKLGKTPNEYQKEISKKAKITVEIK